MEQQKDLGVISNGEKGWSEEKEKPGGNILSMSEWESAVQREQREREGDEKNFYILQFFTGEYMYKTPDKIQYILLLVDAYYYYIMRAKRLRQQNEKMKK